MQLIVVVITGNYVYNDTSAHNDVFSHAMENHIPVLPILEESGIENEFNKKCGDLQYLNPNTTDPTEISFDEKLKNFLDMVLIGDELAEKVRKAFDAYVFLSYRKKDRCEAQKLMRLIHSNDFCRDIAIWYDEFLVPGRKFPEAIQEAMEKSELFTMVVTPNLLENPNYVKDEEYPAATKSGKKILPAVLTPTDIEELKKHYNGIPEPVDAADSEAMAAAFKNALKNVAIRENDGDPQHIFFIGLAYLGGLDVEVNYERAVEMITYAAEKELPEAIEKLVNMYRTGEGVERDYEKSIEWRERLVNVYRKQYNKKRNENNGKNLLKALWSLGYFLYEMDRASKRTFMFFNEMLNVTRKLDGFHRINNINPGWTKNYKIEIYNMLGHICEEKKDFERAEEYYKHELKVANTVVKAGHMPALREVSVAYNNIGRILSATGKYADAKEYYGKALEIRKERAKQDDNIYAWRELAICYDYLGEICKADRDLKGAMEYYGKAHEIFKDIAYKENTPQAQADKSLSYYNIGEICKADGNFEGARKYYEKGIEVNEYTAEQEDNIYAQRNLTKGYYLLGDICKETGDIAVAEEYYEKAVTVCKPLATKTNNAEDHNYLAIIFFHIGSLYESTHNPARAMEYYEKSAEIFKYLAKRPDADTLKAQNDLALTYKQLNIVCVAAGDIIRAKGYYDMFAEINKRIAERKKNPV